MSDWLKKLNGGRRSTRRSKVSSLRFNVLRNEANLYGWQISGFEISDGRRFGGHRPPLQERWHFLRNEPNALNLATRSIFVDVATTATPSIHGQANMDAFAAETIRAFIATVVGATCFLSRPPDRLFWLAFGGRRLAGNPQDVTTYCGHPNKCHKGR
jgi:hypothetical protein